MTWSHEFAVVPTTVIDSDASQGDFGTCVIKEFAFPDYVTASCFDVQPGFALPQHPLSLSLSHSGLQVTTPNTPNMPRH